MKMQCCEGNSGWMARCTRIALLALAGVAVLGWLVMALWNWLLPTLFAGAQPVGYWQALGLLLLCKILFGGWRGGRHRRGRNGHPRLAGMTAQEREQFRSRWPNCCRPERQDGDDAHGE